jgi:WD40 repeat protein
MLGAPEILGYEDDNNWKCHLNKNLIHNGQILSIASDGALLFASSNKSMKLWDIERDMAEKSDLKAPSGIVRKVHFWSGRQIMMAAYDKSIILWDMVSLTSIGNLKVHKEDIRALATGGSTNSLLFSGGKGNPSGGALVIWDIRMQLAPLEEKEKTLDVFSLAVTDSHLFMGCRNHSVYPLSL